MEFHVYDTRLVRKYARFLELAYAECATQFADDKHGLLADTIERMRVEIFDVFARNSQDYWQETYRRAAALLEEEHRARVNSAAARRKREEQRKREREAALGLLETIAA